MKPPFLPPRMMSSPSWTANAQPVNSGTSSNLEDEESGLARGFRSLHVSTGSDALFGPDPDRDLIPPGVPVTKDSSIDGSNELIITKGRRRLRSIDSEDGSSSSQYSGMITPSQEMLNILASRPEIGGILRPSNHPRSFSANNNGMRISMHENSQNNEQAPESLRYRSLDGKGLRSLGELKISSIKDTTHCLNTFNDKDFIVGNNKFAFSPGHLKKLFGPDGLGVFKSLGGLAGLERGLRTDLNSGLSIEETSLVGSVYFEDAVAANSKCNHNRAAFLNHSEKSPSAGGVWPQAQCSQENPLPTKVHHTPPEMPAYFDRKRVFSDNRMPSPKKKGFLQIVWTAYNDKVLVLLTIAAFISLGLGLYEALDSQSRSDYSSLDWVEGVAILIAIMIVVIVSSLNDWQKERQFLKLTLKKDDRMVKVTRSGKIKQIHVNDVLVGDILLMEPGDMAPVDGVYIRGHNLKCDESSNTGESKAVKKVSGDKVYQAMIEGKNVQELDPFIISGAKVVEGVGSYLVTATGVHSSYSKMLVSMRDKQDCTPLQSKLVHLAKRIAKVGILFSLFLLFVLLIEFGCSPINRSRRNAAQKGQDLLSIFITAISVVVVAVPEGLPLAVTLALAFATTQMLKDNNLVRTLKSCETMGNATTICSDKTGTLTQNKMTVVTGMVAGKQFAQPGFIICNDQPRTDYIMKNLSNNDQHPSRRWTGSRETRILPIHDLSPKLLETTRELIVQSIAINSTAYEDGMEGHGVFAGSKTETALLVFARNNLGLHSVSAERSRANIVQFFPFDSTRKYMVSVVKLSTGAYRVYVKGASEILLGFCTKIVIDSDTECGLMEVPITRQDEARIGDVIRSYTSRSLRTIALLYRDIDETAMRLLEAQDGIENPSSSDPPDVGELLQEMTFLGVIGIHDPLREGVREAVEKCKRAGVVVRMVTGDNVDTARAIAEESGIIGPGSLVMEGATFRKLSQEKLKEVVPKLYVLARSSPEDKGVLVKLLKEMGEIVAVTGDGTNDGPALKTADVSFSMGLAGTEVAKQASSIILMDDNFNSIVKALLWGRAVNDSVKKFLQFQLTVNITAVTLTFVTAIASYLQRPVLSAVQMLWVNLIMDTFAALALATDPPNKSLLSRKPEPRNASLISIGMWKMIVGQSIFQLMATLTLHFAGDVIFPGYLLVESRTIVFNSFVWMQIFNEINCRRLDDQMNVFEGLHKNWLFPAIMTLMITGQVSIISFGGPAFQVVRLDASQWAVSIGLGAVSLPLGFLIRCIPDAKVSRLNPIIMWRKQSNRLSPSAISGLDGNQDVRIEPIPQRHIQVEPPNPPFLSRPEQFVASIPKPLNCGSLRKNEWSGEIAPFGSKFMGSDRISAPIKQRSRASSRTSFRFSEILQEMSEEEQDLESSAMNLTDRMAVKAHSQRRRRRNQNRSSCAFGTCKTENEIPATSGISG